VDWEAVGVPYKSNLKNTGIIIQFFTLLYEIGQLNK